jgi:hypothetical protein
MQTMYATEESERLSADHHLSRRVAEAANQRAYSGLELARRAAGVARIVMGVHLVSLHDSEGWRGRTGAKSFRRFLLEEGIEPKAAYQYMAVARAFVLEHGVAPEAIALVGMRVLVDATQYLRPDDPMNQVESNVDEIVGLVTSMPSAEAHEALKERFALERAEPAPARLSKPVFRILNSVDELTHDQRAELYQALRAGPPGRAGAAKSANDISETNKA